MKISGLPSIEKLSDVELEIMFAAAPMHLVSDISKKYSKNKRPSLFYLIFGVYLESESKYIIFLSIFKKLPRKKDGNYFEGVYVDSFTIDSQHEVLNYIYDVIGTFSAHERILNEGIMQLGKMPAHSAFEFLLQWNQNLFEYFNTLISESLPQNKKKTNKID